MSTQKGNNSRSRPQKHQNRTVFKNNLHDTSHRTKFINSIQINDVCLRCKEIIEWKIKYKKYKPLTQPKKCVKCEQKTIKKAYHVICSNCNKNLKICAKCCQPKDIVPSTPDKQELIKLDVEMQQLLQSLPERKRRTFMRYLSKTSMEGESDKDKQKDDLMAKLNALKIDGKDSECEFSNSDDLEEDEVSK